MTPPSFTIDVALERIEDQLAERWAALEQAGTPAGSAAALRLFN